MRVALHRSTKSDGLSARRWARTAFYTAAFVEGVNCPTSIVSVISDAATVVARSLKSVLKLSSPGDFDGVIRSQFSNIPKNRHPRRLGILGQDTHNCTDS